MFGRNLFEPHLRLVRESDGQFTLHALTLTPSGCWQAGPATTSPPPQVLLLPEVQPVVLNLRYNPVFCFQALKPVRHCVANLDLGPKAGKTSVTAFVMYNDRILGSNSIEPRPGQMDQGGDPSSPIIDTSDWFAWVNKMPGATPALYVTGNVTLPTPGYRVTLEPAKPQGVNPRDLILDLKVEKLGGIWPQVVTTKSVRYEQSPYKDSYDSVLVRLPDGAIQLEIEDVV